MAKSPEAIAILKSKIDRLNFIVDEAPRLLALFLGIARYVGKFGIRFSVTGFAHLHYLAPELDSNVRS